MKQVAFIFAFSVITVAATNAPRVSLADLGSAPVRYDGQEIVVDGEVYSGPEMTVMHVPSSPSASEPELMLVTVSERLSDDHSRLYKRFVRSLKRSGQVKATIKGHFESAQSRIFGHQACCRFKLTIDDVIAVK